MDWNGISSLSAFGAWGVVMAFCVMFGGGFSFIYREWKESNRLRQEREENRKQEHEKEIDMLSSALDKIGRRLDSNDDRTDYAESLGMYAHERLDEHLGEEKLTILKKARRARKVKDSDE